MIFKNGGFPCLKYLSINNTENNKNNTNDINKERNYAIKLTVESLVVKKNPSKNIIITHNKEDDLEIV